MARILLLLPVLGGCLIGWPGVDPVDHSFDIKVYGAELSEKGTWPSGRGPNTVVYVLDGHAFFEEDTLRGCMSEIVVDSTKPAFNATCGDFEWGWATELLLIMVDDEDQDPNTVVDQEILGAWTCDAFCFMDAEELPAVPLRGDSAPSYEAVLDDGTVRQLTWSIARR